MKVIIIAIAFIVCVSCYAYDVQSEVFKAIMSYDTAQIYKHRLQKKILNKIPKREIVLTALSYYSTMVGERIHLDQRVYGKKNWTMLFGLEYNKLNRDYTIQINNIIVL